jgi:AraC family transcriptional regulator
MDLFDLFSGAETWRTRRLLEAAQSLTSEQLDQPLDNQTKVFPWDTPDQNLRQILERIIETKEAWAAALTGGDAPDFGGRPPEERTPAALLGRLEQADAAFHRILQDVRNRGAWDDTFVDALCDPPETFTFGGMFAHVITFNAYRRLIALDALRRFGAKIEGFGCPSEYESAAAAPSAMKA